MKSSLIVIAMMAVFGHFAGAEVLEVPAQHATIQAALDATSAHDTVRVAPGNYIEYLVTPSHNVVLLGWYPADTSLGFRTLLNPPPPESETQSAFVLNSDSAIIRNFAIFNSLEVRSVGVSTRSGGIRNFSQHLSLSNCRFDSVLSPIWGGHSVALDNCAFVGCVRQSVLVNQGGAVVASDCFFETGGYAMVTAYDNSRFERCLFKCNTDAGHYLNLFGGHILVSDCSFGPCTGSFPAISLYPTVGCRIINNTFENLDQLQSLLQISGNCDALGDSALYVYGNLFSDYHTSLPRIGTIAIDAQCLQGTSGELAIVDSNDFIDGSATIATAGISAGSSMQINRNAFSNIGPEAFPGIRVTRTDIDSVTARANSFSIPGLAASTQGAYFDARENWWGDSTGPYNGVLNPEGLGAEVGNGVLFIPWLTSPPDFSDTTTDTKNFPVAIPNEYSVAAYPNPFNAETTLELNVAHAGEYSVVLHDVLGRQTAELFHGNIYGTKSIRFSAADLPTGVYFAALRKNHQTLAITKLLLLK
jgi:hypothetical protein